MGEYWLFFIVAAATVASPGPGVLLTLTNALRFGVSGALGGIVGIAAGTFIVAGVSATGVGIVLATSVLAFTVMKFIGAAYLIYLGIKLWRAPPLKMNLVPAAKQDVWRQFYEGFLVQLTNPKSVFFFMSIFPQFFNPSMHGLSRFVLLVMTFSSLILCIHFGYALLAKQAQKWFVSPQGGKVINRASGATFVSFGFGLALTSK